MARHFVQRLPLGLRDEAVAHDRPAIVWMESELEPRAHAPLTFDAVGLASVVVDTSGNNVTRACLSALARSVRSVRVRTADWRATSGGSDAALRAGMPCDSVVGVVVMGPRTESSRQAEHVRLQLHEMHPHALVFTAAIASNEQQLRELGGFDGRIRCATGQEGIRAVLVGLALGAMTAPVLLSCMDLADLKPVLAKDGHVASCVQAEWDTRRRKLVFVSERDRHRVARSSHIAAFTFTESMASATGVSRALRALSPDCAEIMHLAAGNFLSGPLAADTPTELVIILCA